MKTLNILSELISNKKGVRDLKVRQLPNDFGEERFALSAKEYFCSIANCKMPLYEWYFVVKNGVVGYMGYKGQGKDGAIYEFTKTYESVNHGFNSFIEQVTNA